MGESPLTIRLSRKEVHAGATMTLTVEVTVAGSTDVLPSSVTVFDEGGNVVHQVSLDDFVAAEGSKATSISRELLAPVVVGSYLWSFVLDLQPPDVALSGGRVLAPPPVTFDVVPHAPELVVWGVPPTVAPGERFGVMVGAKCSCGRSLAGSKVGIVDRAGGSHCGVLGQEPVEGTAGLHACRIDLVAPEETGLENWVVEFLGPLSDALPYEDHCAAQLAVRTVPTPEYCVSIVAVDVDDDARIPALHVLIHPYRTKTDENGEAQLMVPGGAFTIHVSGFKYAPFRSVINVEGDVKISAELMWLPDLDEYDLASPPAVLEDLRRQKATEEKEQFRHQRSKKARI